MNYQGVLFDLGGTLFEHQSEESARANLLHAAKGIGIPGTPEELSATFRHIRKAVEQEYFECPFYLHRELVSGSITRFAEIHGKSAPESWVSEYCDRQRDAVVSELRLRSDCIDTLKALRNRGVYLSIVSNIDEDYLQPIVNRTKLEAYFNHYTSSEAAGACKPSSEFFYYALGLAGLAPADVLFVGDSLIHDVVGARAIGMDVAWLSSASDQNAESASPVAATATFNIEQLAELVPIIG